MRKNKKRFSIEKIKDNEIIFNTLKVFNPYFLEPIKSTDEELKEYAGKLAQLSEFVVAKNGEEIVGFIVYYMNDKVDKVGYITLIVVKPDYRKDGIIGALAMGQLLTYARKEGENAGIKKVRLEVDKENTHALKLYEKYGCVYMGDASEKSIYMMYDLA
jgi:ribosomal protein S18 acetylase RimI-like enzyme